MKFFRYAVLMACITLCLSLPHIDASRCSRCLLAAGWGLAIKPADAFDPTTLITLSGEVISVEEIAPDREIVPGVYLLFTDGEEQYPVRIGPKESLAGVTIEPFDKIQITGSKVDVDGKPGLIASQIQHKQRTLDLSGIMAGKR